MYVNIVHISIVSVIITGLLYNNQGLECKCRKTLVFYFVFCVYVSRWFGHVGSVCIYLVAFPVWGRCSREGVSSGECSLSVDRSISICFYLVCY